MIQRPSVGDVVFAPISLSSAHPLVFGEARGVLLDTPSQEQAVVYSTREAAEEALRHEPAWHPNNAHVVRVAELIYRGRGVPRFEFATDEEADAHRRAIRGLPRT